MDTDPIQDMQDGWRAELPKLDTSAMVTVARLNRFAGLLRRQLEESIGDLGSSLGHFDVLSALRRQGPPYEMKPSELARAVMLSPSGMTHRVDLLEADGLVHRTIDPTSRRTSPVALTADGVAASEQLAREVITVENRALGALSISERRQLDKLLAKALDGLANDGVEG